MNTITNKANLDHFKACIIGGSIGDALGAPIEFMSMDQIRDEFGYQGLTDYSPAFGRFGAITDDTQMILTGHKELFSLRAPGNSCLSAGTLAAIISIVISGESLLSAINESIRILKARKNNQETLGAIHKAVEMANQSPSQPDVIRDIGAGWIAEEALGISIYCSLSSKDDFQKGVLLSVNHSGDSDSTGSITGNILGALYGIDFIPENWIRNLELKDLIEEIAGDLFDRFR